MRSRSSSSSSSTCHLIVTASVALALVVACSVDVDVTGKDCPCGDGFVCEEARNVCVLPQDLKPAALPACDPCTCTTDDECKIKDPLRPRCNPTTKTCVECLTTPTDNCRASQYCNAANQCISGCKQASDCTISPNSPHCEATRHQCVECTAAAPCADATKACSPSGSCVESCATKPCSAGRECCSGLCLDLTSDILNCGGCDKRCDSQNGTAKCVSSACQSECANGFANCDQVANNGCETSTRTLAHCGSCTGNCDKIKNAADLTCASGSCSFTNCAAGFLDADNDKSNGCETPCGRNGQPCCAGGTCTEGSCKPPNPPTCR
jgi:hypothetical protein